MGSEFLRDAGVLALVFALLDKVVIRPWRGIWWTVGVTLLILLSAPCCLCWECG